jgi:chromosome segregation ATPase
MEMDAGQIAVAVAVAVLLACIALRSSRQDVQNAKNIEGEVLTQIRNELRDANASLRHVKDAVQHQQAALEKTAATLESMRRNADDHASDIRSGIEGVSAAIDTARTETAARDNSMSERIDAVRNAAAAAQEHAANADLTTAGLRKQIDVVAEQSAGFPELRIGIERVQQNVTAIAEAMPKPRAGATPAANSDRQSPRDKRRRQNKRTRKAAAEQAPPNAEAQPSEPAAAGTPAPQTAGEADAGRSASEAVTEADTGTAAEAAPAAATPTDDTTTPAAGTAAGNGAAGSDATPPETDERTAHAPDAALDAENAGQQAEASR